MMNLRLGPTGMKIVMEFKIQRRTGATVQKDSSGPVVKHEQMQKVAMLERTSLTRTRELRHGRRGMEDFSINQVPNHER
jgi:hypothetical protein